MTLLRPWAAVLVALVLIPAAGWAVLPSEMLVDPALEARAREISRGLRCLVCQNETIDDSNSDLARDLRLLVRERLVAGDTDAEAVAYITARYGDFVLLDPPFKPATWALWLGPAALLVAGGALTIGFYRRRSAATAPPPLSPEESDRLAALERDAGAS